MSPASPTVTLPHAAPASATPSVAALVVAAGRGERAGGGLPKQYRAVGGKPLLRWSLDAFAAHPAVGRTVVAIGPGQEALFEAAATGVAATPVPGGAERQQSVLAGLRALAADPPEVVLIHDAARPFLDAATIDRLLDALGHGALGALPVLAVADTLKRGTGHRVETTVDRSGLWRAQTPQAFRFAEILAAHESAAREATAHGRGAGVTMTDDTAVAEAAGMEVTMVEGAESLFKVTTADDFERAERHLAASSETRVGIGYDVHRFGPGDHVMLCGIAVPHDQALAGHSDADVGLHAVTDAVLGAISAGDIGHHFPPTDPRWKGASSDQFLAHAASLVRAAGGTITHLDVTLICERPKIGPHREAMVARIAEIVDIRRSRVSVKATTTEKLGFTGRREGIAAEAVATIRLPAETAEPD